MGIDTIKVTRYQSGAHETAWQLPSFYDSTGWEFGQVQVDSGGENKYYYIWLEVYRGNTSDGYAAIDEIGYIEVDVECPTVLGPDETATSAAPPPPTAEPGLCNLEDGFCDWVEAGTEHFMWRRHTGLEISEGAGEILGPYHDFQGANTTYFAVAAVDPRTGDGGGDSTELVRTFGAGDWCLHFWYVMDVRDGGLGTQFRIVSIVNGEPVDVWRMSEEDVAGMASPDWKEGALRIMSEEATEHKVMSAGKITLIDLP